MKSSGRSSRRNNKSRAARGNCGAYLRIACPLKCWWNILRCSRHALPYPMKAKSNPQPVLRNGVNTWTRALRSEGHSQIVEHNCLRTSVCTINVCSMAPLQKATYRSEYNLERLSNSSYACFPELSITTGVPRRFM